MSDTPETDALRDRCNSDELIHVENIFDLANKFERKFNESCRKIERQADRIKYLEGATNHATGTPLSNARRECKELRGRVEGLENKWEIAVKMAALASVELDDLQARLSATIRDRDEWESVAKGALLETIEERDSFKEQLDAALMIGKMQERRHDRELKETREQYRFSSVCRGMQAQIDMLTKIVTAYELQNAKQDGKRPETNMTTQP